MEMWNSFWHISLNTFICTRQEMETLEGFYAGWIIVSAVTSDTKHDLHVKCVQDKQMSRRNFLPFRTFVSEPLCKLVCHIHLDWTQLAVASTMVFTCCPWRLFFVSSFILNLCKADANIVISSVQYRQMCTKNYLTDRLCPYPLRELTALPQTCALGGIGRVTS